MRLHSKAIGLAAVSLAVLALLSGCTSSTAAATTSKSKGTFAESPGTIVVGNLPDETSGESGFQPVADYLAKKTGLKVKFLPTTSYPSLIAAAVAGKVDVFTAGALEYEQVKAKGGKYTPVSLQMTPGSTQPGYHSEAWVPKSSGITSVSQFKGKKICFVSPDSTSGYLFPLSMLSQAGINVKQTGTDANGNPTFADFTAIFAGSHPKSLQSIAAGQCDVGFADDIDTVGYQTGLKAIKSVFVPGVPWEVSDALPASVKAKVTKALQTANPAQMKAAGITLTSAYTASNSGVVPFKESYYSSIDTLCKTIKAADC